MGTFFLGFGAGIVFTIVVGSIAAYWMYKKAEKEVQKWE